MQKKEKILSAGGFAPKAPKQPPIANFLLRAGVSITILQENRLVRTVGTESFNSSITVSETSRYCR